MEKLGQENFGKFVVWKIEKKFKFVFYATKCMRKYCFIGRIKIYRTKRLRRNKRWSNTADYFRK